MVWGNHTGSQHMDTSRNRRFSCGTISRTTVKIKVLHQNLYILMGTKKKKKKKKKKNVLIDTVFDNYDGIP